MTSQNCTFFWFGSTLCSRILCGSEMVLGSSKASWNSVRICKSALCFWPVRKHPLSSLLYYQSYSALKFWKKCNKVQKSHCFPWALKSELFKYIFERSGVKKILQKRFFIASKIILNSDEHLNHFYGNFLDSKSTVCFLLWSCGVIAFCSNFNAHFL